MHRGLSSTVCGTFSAVTRRALSLILLQHLKAGQRKTFVLVSAATVEQFLCSRALWLVLQESKREFSKQKQQNRHSSASSTRGVSLGQLLTPMFLFRVWVGVFWVGLFFPFVFFLTSVIFQAKLDLLFFF